MSGASKRPWLYRASGWVRRPAKRLWPFHIEGVAHVPERGAAIVASNHASFMDPWVVGISVDRRTVRYLINAPWYERSRVWKAVFRGYGAIPAAPADPKQTLDRVVAVLARGGVVGVFPEGKLSPGGVMGRFQPGVALFAARSGAPVVPCGLVGTRESAPPPRKVPWPRPLRIGFGAPIVFPGAPAERPSAASVARFTGRVERAVRDLVASLERLRAPDVGGGRSK